LGGQKGEQIMYTIQLDEKYIDEFLEFFERASWKDGKETAGQAVKQIKINHQWPGRDKNNKGCVRSQIIWPGRTGDGPEQNARKFPEMEGVAIEGEVEKLFYTLYYKMFVENKSKIEEAIHQSISPKMIGGMTMAKYIKGDGYGWHTDNPGLYPQLSCTIALNNHDEYEGGILEYDSPYGLIQTRLKKGEMFLYPTMWKHRVTTITKGERKVMLSWIPVKKWNINKTFLLSKIDKVLKFLWEENAVDGIYANKELREAATRLSEVFSFLKHHDID
jgi:predicted 2-oxoglutarate/Fe(II)-dependent dioxygenase YbiX